jgi:hypothetical protein
MTQEEIITIVNDMNKEFKKYQWYIILQLHYTSS